MLSIACLLAGVEVQIPVVQGKGAGSGALDGDSQHVQQGSGPG